MGISVCDLQHKRCSQCPPSGCLLCKFNGLRSWINSSLDNLPHDIEPIVRYCDALEKKFEETQQINSNNANVSYLRDDSASMDVDYNPVPVQSTFFINKTQLVIIVLYYSIDSSVPKPNIENNDCRICLDDLGASYVTLPTCQHPFHRDCIEKWFQSSGKQTCPSCGYLYGINKGRIH